MENFETQFCRLCLNSITDKNYKVIDSVTRQDLDVLLKLNFDDAHKQIICTSCSEKLDAAVKFKSTCLDTDRVIHTYVGFGDFVPIDLRMIYLKETGIGELDEEICRLCMQPVKKQFVSVCEVDTNILQNYIPEVNFGATMNPVICKPCVDSLIVHSTFIKDCLDVEEKVKRFFTGETVDSSADVTHLDSCIENVEIKKEIDNEVVFKSEINSDGMEEMDNEVGLVKVEGTEIKMENVDEESLQSSQDFNKSEDKKTVVRHVTVDKDALKLQWHACEICNRQFKYKSRLKKHSLVHLPVQSDASGTQYECDVCLCKLKNKHTLSEHMVIHKDASEIQWLDCDMCSYKAKRKKDLNGHMLTHKDASEIQWYECDACDYKSKYKSGLNAHVIIHKDDSEIPWFQCEICDYKSKRKYYLTQHNRIHKVAPEIQYECEVCHCKFKNRITLGKHMLIHKDASEIRWFECHICGYKAKRRGNLNGHMLTHKDASEIQWFECDLCDYKSKRRGGLNDHMMVHKDASEIQWFECQECDYKSKYKNHLNKHIQTHRVTSESQ